MHRQRVSFSDCSSSAGILEGKNSERYNDLKKMESRKNVLSRAYGTDSHDSGDEDIRREISNVSTEAAGFRVYKSMVSQPNERLGAQIYEKRQRVWLGTFNGEEETAKAIAAFKLGGCDAVTELKPRLEVGHPENRLLSAHSKKDIVDILISNSKNIDRLQLHNCSETEQEEEEKDRKGFEYERIDNSVGGEDDKKATPWLREHMFEKTVTPSDVGKLNRLVIPKQHAEKYFPLDTYTIEKGLLLSFEDSSGKPWRFRYSYWNSSQSYVLTKGWSRFVKDKKLDAGDIVAFDRETHQDPNLQRLFIRCRRKPFSSARPPGLALFKHPLQLTSPFQFPSDAINNNGGRHAQQLVSSRDHLIGPQWMPLFWPANNMSGESSRGAAETGILRTANTQPMDLLTLARKGIRESGFPFSDTRECGRPAMDTESSARASAPDVIQLKSRGFSRDDLSFPIENKVPEVAATSFDHSTSKKVLRLFGVDLECGK